ncbi:MAG: hypothetical protein Q9163_005981 [Psora crenata]
MATSLAAQLAHIHVNSTNPLELKAQKRGHSQSLLFDPYVAATQDFDTIYRVSYEGFQDLCRLDNRFRQFAVDLFSEQSKQEDRTQMTVAQNEQLDVVLEGFLGLVGAKLLLKPALKSVEWLIRRFRVHEHNTMCLALTFLPYHEAPVFATLLSILPQTTPPTLKFLQPYIKSLTCPSHHTIVYTASNNRLFLAALSSYVFKACRFGHQYPTLISFWASTTGEAVAEMCGQSRHTRLEAVKQNQKELMLFLLPILNEALSLTGITDLRVASYMVLTVLASKSELDDGVLAAMMEAVVTPDWTETANASLISLATLAERMRDIKLPKRVFKALVSHQRLQEDLVALHNEYNVGKLAFGTVLGIIRRLGRSCERSDLRLLRGLLEARLMPSASGTVAFKKLLLFSKGIDISSNALPDTRESAADLVLCLAGSPIVGAEMQAVIEESRIDIGQVDQISQKVIHKRKRVVEHPPGDTEIDDVDQQEELAAFDELAAQIPTNTAYELSFLSHSDSYVFASLEKAFQGLCSSPINVEKFSNLPVLRKSLALNEPLFLSFYARVWCGTCSANVRVAAVLAVRKFVSEETRPADVQFLLPYILYGLSDAAPLVRGAIGDLILSLTHFYALADTGNVALPIVGHGQIYGPGEESRKTSWLSCEDVRHLFAAVLAPSLEECLLDPHHLSCLLVANISGSRQVQVFKNVRSELKMASRISIFTSLSSHAVNTPLFAVKFFLLQMLSKIEKVGSTCRTKLLLPILSNLSEMAEAEVTNTCERDKIDISDLVEAAVGAVIPSDIAGMHALKDIIERRGNAAFPRLQAAALQRLQGIWSAVRPDLQSTFATILLELSLPASGNTTTAPNGAKALEILTSLPLSTATLESFLDDLPTLPTHLRSGPSAPKRRRLSNGQSTQSNGTSLGGLEANIRKISLVLELVEGSKTRGHHDLLNGLFKVFIDLQCSQKHAQSSVAYLQVLAMDAMLATVNEIRVSPNTKVDTASIRADVLFDCIRNTPSPQVRNAGLRLLSALANLMPELVLHSVMPVITFIASTGLHEEAEYSSRIIKQTMDSIIPRLVGSLHKRKGSSLSSVSDLLLSFAAAFEHVPSQRRLELYTSLIDKIGPDTHLYAFLVILMDKYPRNRRVIEFAANLTNRYDVESQLKTVARYLEGILDTSRPKPTVLVDIMTFAGKQNIMDLWLNLLPLVPAILTNRPLISVSRKALAQNDGDNAFKLLYEHALDQMFLVIDKFDEHRRLRTLGGRALDAMLNLLPMSALADAFPKLMERTQAWTRQHVLASVKHRLGDKLNVQSAQKACLQFMPRLVAIIRDTSDISLKLTAISAIDRIVTLFGKRHLDAVVDCAGTIASRQYLRARELAIRVASLSCLVSIVGVARDALIPLMPFAVPAAIDNLEESVAKGTKMATVHNMVYSFFKTLLLHIPWLMNGDNLDRLMTLSQRSASSCLGKQCDEARREAVLLIGERIEARICIGALDRTWDTAMAEGPIAVKEHLDILRLLIEQQPKSTIVKHSGALGDFFLKAFDLRRTQSLSQVHGVYGDDGIAEAEGAINVCAIAMVYKLNDSTFRPFFTRAMDWATISLDKEDLKFRNLRRTTWYTFLSLFFSTLKVSLASKSIFWMLIFRRQSIVTSYATVIIEDAVGVLNSFSPTDMGLILLWRQVLQTLHATFAHDQDDFYQIPSHFTPISSALIFQLSHAAHISMEPEIIPAIVELAVATDSSALHKEMNAAILKYTRSDGAAVRLAAVKCERALTDRLGEEWLALLPEMLPYISELQEDDDEVIEKETLRWIQRIEEILGESLNSMLQ